MNICKLSSINLHEQDDTKKIIYENYNNTIYDYLKHCTWSLQHFQSILNMDYIINMSDIIDYNEKQCQCINNQIYIKKIFNTNKKIIKKKLF